MLTSDRFFNETLARSSAIALLVELRSSKRINKEQLFADTVAFYRWLFSDTTCLDTFDYYEDLFNAEHPTIDKRLEPALREACFITWFLERGYDKLPAPDQQKREE